MQYDQEIWAILDSEESAATERALWMKGLPKQVGTLVRVAIAAVHAVCAVRWHEKNGGLRQGEPTLWEAKQLRDDMFKRLESTLTEEDYKVFAQCVNIIEDMSHSDKDCALCTNVPVEFSDRQVWGLLTV